MAEGVEVLSTSSRLLKTFKSKMRWHPSANGGGGFANVGAVDPQNAGHLAAIGDVYGVRKSDDGGATWYAANKGASAVPTGRACAFSLRPATSNLCWVGIGTPTGGVGTGYFGFISPNGSNALTQLDANPHGFGTNIASNNTVTPRANGNTICIDYDSGADQEWVYAFAPNQITRYQNDASHHPLAGSTCNPVILNSTVRCWKTALWIDDTHILACTYTLDVNGNAVTPNVFLISASSGTLRQATAGKTSVTSVTVTGGPATKAVNHFRSIGGVVYAVCTSGLYSVGTPNSTSQTWTRLGSGFFDSSGTTVLSDICGSGNLLYVAQSDTGQNLTTGHAVAKSTDAGANWSYVANTVSQNNYGTSVRWWLTTKPSFLGELNGTAWDTGEIAYDASQAKVHVLGRMGAYVSDDAGANWYPSMAGLNGTVASNVSVSGDNVTVYCSDTDFTNELSTDRMLTCVQDSTGPGGGYPAPALTRTVTIGGVSHTFTVVNGTPMDITRDGISIADDVFRGWAINGNVADLAVGTDGTVYVVSTGGGMYVGRPISLIQGAYRAFTSSSWWNTPLDFGGNAPADANTTTLMTALQTYSGNQYMTLTGTPTASPDQAQPIYFPVASDHLYTVDGYNIRIPAGAVPNGGASPKMLVIDTTTNQSLGMTGAAYNAGTDTWTVTGSDRYLLNSEGIADNVSPAGTTGNTGHRGATFANKSPRIAEVDAGVIAHRLECFVRPDKSLTPPNFTPGLTGANGVWPMSNSDGDAGAISEGYVLRIKRTVDLPGLGLSGAALVIAKACQDYGVMVTDGGGNNTTIRLEWADPIGDPTFVQGAWTSRSISETSLSAVTFNNTNWEFVQAGYRPPGSTP